MSEPYYQDDSVTLYHGDCLDVLRALPDASVDSVVTDPPYGLEFMGKDWDAPWRQAPGSWADRNPADHARPDSRGQTASPFLSAQVNKYAAGLPFQQWCELWTTECLRVLKPGGHMLAFGGTRTWHRLACAVEDAGFEVRDSIAWLYGSGFPKSLDVSKAIDKRPGVMRHAEFGAMLREAMTAKGYTNTFDVAEKVIGRRTGAVANWIKYQFPEAKWWPALRDLLDLDDDTWGPVIAEAERQKIGTRAGNRLAVAPGQGEDRSAIDLDVTSHATDAAQQWAGWGTALKPAFEPVVVARKPLSGTVAANVLAHGTGALNIDACRVEGEPWKAHSATGLGKVKFFTEGETPVIDKEPHTAGRWPANVVLDDSQAAELDEQSGESRSPGAYDGRYTDGSSMFGIGGVNHDNEYGDSGGASRFFKVISQTPSTPDLPTFRYEAKAPTSERPRVNGTAHPTVKPLDLMRWLVRLVTPPGGTVLEPFAGSGTTVEACIVEGFHCIAIEREADYLPLIMQRVHRRRDPVAYIEAAGDDLGLFGIGELA